MLFSQPQFFAFFAGYLLLHFMIPARFRLFLVIGGGAVFYAWWRPDYLWIPVLLTALAFTGVLWMEKAEPQSKKARLIVVLTLLLAPLLVVKYSYFLATNLGAAAGMTDPETDFAILKFGLPLGISFITFTAIAYVVDVFRRRFAPERNVGVVLAYVMFFPHLVAGPILRPHELIPQLKQLRAALGARFLTGAGIFTLGLFKKLAIADQLAGVVDPVFNSAGADISALAYLLAIYGFSVQIYCDFSGYTDMAIGLAYILRIRLPTNFLRPYSSTSITEFWRRWHITLSHWLRDYLYIPLGGNRLGSHRRNLNLMITMALGGLWHGANWTFLVWGLLHGSALVVSHSLKRFSIRIPKWIAILFTFHFVTIAWVFFRAADFSTAIRVLEGPFAGGWGSFLSDAQANAFMLAILGFFFLTHHLDRHARIRLGLQRVSWAIAVPIMAFFWIAAFALSQGNSAKFIYFDF